MSDLLRSAFNYFNIQPQPVTTPLLGKTDHALVGSVVEVGTYRIKIRSLIAEGGYALVFSGQDSEGKWYALKRQLAADKDAADAIVREIEFLRALSGHPSIIKFYQAAQVASRESHGRNEYLLLTELCTGGNVVELLQKGPLSVSQVVKIFTSACQAVRHMHSKKPPVTHRDLKVENLLFDSTGRVKLCDFGSATTDVFKPDDTWNASRRTYLEEDLARFTTPMYRAPEVLDVYSNYIVGPPQDIWALGCVLYYLCYRKHPFEDSAKLRIINAKYTFPDNDKTYTVFQPLIKGCLQIDPQNRLCIEELCEKMKQVAFSTNIRVEQPVEGVNLPVLNPSVNAENFGSGDRFDQQRQPSGHEYQQHSVVAGAAPSRPPPFAVRKPGPAKQESSAQQQASAVLGVLKGQGMSWLRNIKDRTAAVAQTVQSTYGGRGPDVLFITSRVVVAPISEAIPDALASQAEEAMRAYILEHGRGRFAVYNLSSRRLRCEYSDRLNELPMPPQSSGVVPTLKVVLSVCQNMIHYLQQSPTNFVLITGPECYCFLMAAALLLYGRLFTKPYMALQLIQNKRNLLTLPPSSHLVLELLSTVVNCSPQQIRSITHNRQVSLYSLVFSPIPKFNIAKTGCRPIVDVLAGGSKLFSTRKSYEMLKTFDQPHTSEAEIELDSVIVTGDVQIIVHHARWSKVYGRIQEFFMFSLCFHSNFIDPNTHLLEMSVGDLDIHSDDEGKFDQSFRVGVRLKIGDCDRGFNSSELPAFLSYDANHISNHILVSEPEEYDSIVHSYCHTDAAGNSVNAAEVHGNLMGKVQPTTTNLTSAVQQMKLSGAQPTANAADFFSSLSWNDDNTSNSGPHRTEQAGSMARAAVKKEVPISTTSKKRDVAEEYERMYGIRVGGDEVEDPDAALYKFDYEKEVRKETKPPKMQNNPSLENVDLLGLDNDSNTWNVKCNGCKDEDLTVGNMHGDGTSYSQSKDSMNELLDAAAPIGAESNDDEAGGDLLSWSSVNSADRNVSMQRNVSAPLFSTTSTTKPTFDPFADFLATHPDPAPTSSNSKSGESGPNSGRVTPNVQKPNYSRSHFDALSSIGGLKPKLNDNTFDDLLTPHGFTSSKSQKSISEMRREEENKQLDPVSIKMRDWTSGKEGNIRALLGSLNDVLWPGADKWVQPSMADLLAANQVKKYYRKACLVIHPDKQVGTENEDLARAIFTELNDAWSAFEAAGSPAL